MGTERKVEPRSHLVHGLAGPAFSQRASEIHTGNWDYCWDSCLQSLPHPSLVLPSFLTAHRGCREQEHGVLLRLRAEQFHLLCFLFCPSLKDKDVPALLQDCTSLCPDNHETARGTEILSPCPLPPLEKKC